MAETIVAAPSSHPPSSSPFSTRRYHMTPPLNAPSNEASVLTGQAAVQPRVENGNANPPGGVRGVGSCVNFSGAPVLSFSPSEGGRFRG